MRDRFGLVFGMSYMGLAWASIAGAVVQLVAIIHYTDRGIPVGPSLRHANEILKFGIIAVGGTVLRRLSPNLPDLILGRVATMNDVGIFSRGFGAVLFLNELCIQALEAVVLPYLSSVHRDGQSVADAYRLGLRTPNWRHVANVCRGQSACIAHDSASLW